MSQRRLKWEDVSDTTETGVSHPRHSPRRVTFGGAYPTEPLPFWEKTGLIHDMNFEATQLDLMAKNVAFSGEGWEEFKEAKNKFLNKYSDPRLRQHGGLLEEGFMGAVGLVPALTMASYEGAKTATGFAAGGAAMGAMAIPGPDPLDLVTAPVGGLIGAKVGFATGAANFWWHQGTGMMYSALREQGVSHETARNISSTSAVPYAAVELLQAGKLIPARKLVQNAATRHVRNRPGLADTTRRAIYTEAGGTRVPRSGPVSVMGKEIPTRPLPTTALREVGDIGVQVGQEVIQEGIQIGAEEAGRFMDNVEHPKSAYERFTDSLGRLVEVARHSALAFPFLKAPGASFNFYNAALEQRRQGLIQKARQEIDEVANENPELAKQLKAELDRVTKGATEAGLIEGVEGGRGSLEEDAVGHTVEVESVVEGVDTSERDQLILEQAKLADEATTARNEMDKTMAHIDVLNRDIEVLEGKEQRARTSKSKDTIRRQISEAQASKAGAEARMDQLRAKLRRSRDPVERIEEIDSESAAMEEALGWEGMADKFYQLVRNRLNLLRSERREALDEIRSLEEGEAGVVGLMREEEAEKHNATMSAVGYAEKAGLDLSDVKGKGKGGQIRLKDVQRHVRDRKQEAPQPEDGQSTEDKKRRREYLAAQHRGETGPGEAADASIQPPSGVEVEQTPGEVIHEEGGVQYAEDPTGFSPRKGDKILRNGRGVTIESRRDPALETLSYDHKRPGTYSGESWIGIDALQKLYQSGEIKKVFAVTKEEKAPAPKKAAPKKKPTPKDEVIDPEKITEAIRKSLGGEAKTETETGAEAQEEGDINFDEIVDAVVEEIQKTAPKSGKTKKGGKKREPNYGKDNIGVTQSEAAEAKAVLNRIAKDVADSGVQMAGMASAGKVAKYAPEILKQGVKLGLHHVEAGARTFAKFAERMTADLGDWIKPYLLSIYNNIRTLPGYREMEIKGVTAAEAERILAGEEAVAEELKPTAVDREKLNTLAKLRAEHRRMVSENAAALSTTAQHPVVYPHAQSDIDALSSQIKALEEELGPEAVATLDRAETPQPETEEQMPPWAELKDRAKAVDVPLTGKGRKKEQVWEEVKKAEAAPDLLTTQGQRKITEADKPAETPMATIEEPEGIEIKETTLTTKRDRQVAEQVKEEIEEQTSEGGAMAGSNVKTIQISYSKSSTGIWTDVADPGVVFLNPKVFAQHDGARLTKLVTHELIHIQDIEAAWKIATSAYTESAKEAEAETDPVARVKGIFVRIYEAAKDTPTMRAVGRDYGRGTKVELALEYLRMLKEREASGKTTEEDERAAAKPSITRAITNWIVHVIDKYQSRHLPPIVELYLNASRRLLNRVNAESKMMGELNEHFYSHGVPLLARVQQMAQSLVNERWIVSKEGKELEDKNADLAYDYYLNQLVKDAHNWITAKKKGGKGQKASTWYKEGKGFSLSTAKARLHRMAKTRVGAESRLLQNRQRPILQEIKKLEKQLEKAKGDRNKEEEERLGEMIRDLQSKAASLRGELLLSMDTLEASNRLMEESGLSQERFESSMANWERMGQPETVTMETLVGISNIDYEGLEHFAPDTAALLLRYHFIHGHSIETSMKLVQAVTNKRNRERAEQAGKDFVRIELDERDGHAWMERMGVHPSQGIEYRALSVVDLPTQEFSDKFYAEVRLSALRYSDDVIELPRLQKVVVDRGYIEIGDIGSYPSEAVEVMGEHGPETRFRRRRSVEQISKPETVWRLVGGLRQMAEVVRRKSPELGTGTGLAMLPTGRGSIRIEARKTAKPELGLRDIIATVFPPRGRGKGESAVGGYNIASMNWAELARGARELVAHEYFRNEDGTTNWARLRDELNTFDDPLQRNLMVALALEGLMQEHVSAGVEQENLELLHHFSEALKAHKTDPAQQLALQKLVNKIIGGFTPLLSFLGVLRTKQQAVVSEAMGERKAETVNTAIKEAGRRAVDESDKEITDVATFADKKLKDRKPKEAEPEAKEPEPEAKEESKVEEAKPERKKRAPKKTDEEKARSKVVREGVKELRERLRNILFMSIESQRLEKDTIYDALNEDELLRDLPDDDKITINNLLLEVWQKKRKKAFEQEYAKLDVNLTKEDQKRLVRSLPRLLKYSNVGALTDELFWNAMAPEFGLPTFDGTLAMELQELAQKAQDTPQGVIQNQILATMLRHMQDNMPVDLNSWIRDFWYASVLSGVRTHWDVLTGSVANGFIQSVTMTLDSLSAAETRQDAANIILSWLTATHHGAAEAWDIIKTGDFTRLPDAQERMYAQMDGSIDFDNLEKLDRDAAEMDWKEGWWRKVAGKYKYTRRVMIGLDYVGSLATREAAIMHAATLRGGDQVSAARKRMDKAEWDRAMERAQKELEDAADGGKVKKVAVRARAREILNEELEDDIILHSVEMGRVAALNAKPLGISGAVYDIINKASFYVKAPLGLAFARAALNMVSIASNFTPVLGWINYHRTKEGGWLRVKDKDDGTAGTWNLDRDDKVLSALGHEVADVTLTSPGMTNERARLIRIQHALGTALMTALWLVFIPDEDEEGEREIDIEGGWLGLDHGTRSQLYSQGKKPHSIRMGDVQISYKNWPAFAVVLAAIGAARDKQKYRPDKWDEESEAMKLANAYGNGLIYMRDISMLSHFIRIMGLGTATRPATPISWEGVGQRLSEAASSTLPLVTIAGTTLAKEVETMLFDSKYYRPSVWYEYGYRYMPIVRSAVGEGPMLNILGEPVTIVRQPLQRQTTLIENMLKKPDPVWVMLAEKAEQGVFLPRTSNQVKIWIDGEKRVMTEKEYYLYTRTMGKTYREYLEENLEEIRKMDRDETMVRFDWMGRMARSHARLALTR